MRWRRGLAGTSHSGVPLHRTLACGFVDTRDYLVRCIVERVVSVDACLTEVASTDPCQKRQQASLRSCFEKVLGLLNLFEQVLPVVEEDILRDGIHGWVRQRGG